MTKEKRYNPVSEYLKERFGIKVYKVSINAGFTCPTKDGKKGFGGCIYCEPKTLIREEHAITITEQIERGIKRLKKAAKAQKFIAYFQINTNTYGDIEHLEKLYREAMTHPDIVGLAISTRPDCVDDEVFKLLKELNKEKPLWLELGLQSANDSTLIRIMRGHTAAQFKNAVERANAYGIDVCCHVMMGLLGEEKSDMLNTIRFVSGLKIWGIKFHQLEVIKNTPLEALYKKGEVKVLTVEEYVDIVVESLAMLPPLMTIHRLSATSPRDLLLAPLWGLNKFYVKETIEKELIKRNIYQGINT